MGLFEGRGNLGKATKELLQKWAETKSQWQDSAAEEFQARRIDPIQQDVKNAMSAMDHMATMIQQARRDAGE